MAVAFALDVAWDVPGYHLCRAQLGKALSQARSYSLVLNKYHSYPYTPRTSQGVCQVILTVTRVSQAQRRNPSVARVSQEVLSSPIPAFSGVNLVQGVYLSRCPLASSLPQSPLLLMSSDRMEGWFHKTALERMLLHESG